MAKQRKQRRLAYAVLAAVLTAGAFLIGPAPIGPTAVAAGQCDCQGGYNYAFDAKPCSAGGTNCAVCSCPPAK